ncbi:MAG TPA: LCP family protein [Thermoanaerobaculia bacterium]|nr:LCP family protein [Thermoanaerobaculia bacterium]
MAHPSRLRPELNDTIRPSYTPPPGKKRSRVAEYVMYGFIALLLVIAGIAAYTHYSPSWQKVPNHVAEGMKQDRINILLIGIGGPTHPGEGKDLADAIMVVSLKPSTRQVALMSIPRDFYLKIGTFGTHRLNAAHSLGYKAGYPGEGPGLLVDTVSQIIGQPIHGYMRVDFLAFEKVIDALGGVDIYVYRPFYDFLFKDGFTAGWHHMNGQRALRYARYRYVRASAEGNNFARELRQQQVIDAVRQKVANLSPQQALRLVALASTSSKFTATNLTTPQMVELYSTFHNVDRKHIRNVSLKKFTEIVMVRVPGDTGEAVRPINNDYTRLHQVFADVFNGSAPIVMRDEIQLTDVGAPPAAPAPKQPVMQQQAAAVAP